MNNYTMAKASRTAGYMSQRGIDPYSSQNMRNSCAEDGTPITVGKARNMAWFGNRKHAHPKFTERNGRVKAMPMR